MSQHEVTYQARFTKRIEVGPDDLLEDAQDDIDPNSGEYVEDSYEIIKVVEVEDDGLLTFDVYLAPPAVERLGQMHVQVRAGGGGDVGGELDAIGVDDKTDVRKIEVVGQSDQDWIINDSIRQMEERGVRDIVLGVGEDVYLIASVLHGGLVEFQVSNGPPDNRGTSHDFYAFSEAKEEFDRIMTWGW